MKGVKAAFIFIYLLACGVIGLCAYFSSPWFLQLAFVLALSIPLYGIHQTIKEKL
jgi:hypothetical protein